MSWILLLLYTSNPEMIYLIKPEQQQELLRLPETGMGYQVINASISNSYTRKKYLVLNSEIAIDLDDTTDENIKKLMSEGILTIKRNAPDIEFKDLHIDTEFNMVDEPIQIYGNKGAIENPKQTATGTEKLVRLSAFEHDKRLDTIYKRLRPGSYTTSYDNYKMCKSKKMDPVSLYALPDTRPVEWVFHIQPKANDEFQYGTVQPANGKKGGGEEYFFWNGTSENTYLPPPETY
ncbi:MAG: hypothetical protein ACJ75F_07705 [Flavisolibacter sp.]